MGRLYGVRSCRVGCPAAWPTSTRSNRFRPRHVRVGGYFSWYVDITQQSTPLTVVASIASHLPRRSLAREIYVEFLLRDGLVVRPLETIAREVVRELIG